MSILLYNKMILLKRNVFWFLFGAVSIVEHLFTLQKKETQKWKWPTLILFYALGYAKEDND